MGGREEREGREGREGGREGGNREIGKEGGGEEKKGGVMRFRSDVMSMQREIPCVSDDIIPESCAGRW